MAQGRSGRRSRQSRGLSHRPRLQNESVRGRADLPLLRLENKEAPIRSWSVRLRGEFLVQRPQLPFEVVLERGHGGAEAIATAGGVGSSQQRLEADDLIPDDRSVSCLAALEPTADELADFVDAFRCEAVAIDFKALQIFGVPHLESENFQHEIRGFENLDTLLRVPCSHQDFQQVPLDPFHPARIDDFGDLLVWL